MRAEVVHVIGRWGGATAAEDHAAIALSALRCAAAAGFRRNRRSWPAAESGSSGRVGAIAPVHEASL